MILKVAAIISISFFGCISNATVCNYEVKTNNDKQMSNETRATLIRSHRDALESEMARLQKNYLTAKNEITIMEIISLHQEKQACLNEERKIKI